MVDFNLTIKDQIDGLVAKLWSNNEQNINTLGTYKFSLLTFYNFDYDRYLPLTMDIDEPWFAS
jgi:hypothetical protein